MIDTDQFRKRAAKLYGDCRTRWRKQMLKKMAPEIVNLIAPQEILPFSQAAFTKWLWDQLGLQAVPCPYCRTPIDILSLGLDHKTPLRRRGGPELENLQISCQRCNGIKGEFTAEEFAVIVAMMDGAGAFFRQRLEGVLINGNLGNQMRNFPRGKKDGHGKKTLSGVPQQETFFTNEAPDDF